MKKSIYLFCILLIVSCKKENQVTFSPSIIGEWSWIESCGGIGGFCYTPQSTKAKIKLVFTTDSICNSYRNDTLILSDRFHISSTYSSDNKIYISIIKYEKSSIDQTSVISHDTIFLDDFCCDLYSSRYKRIK